MSFDIISDGKVFYSSSDSNEKTFKKGVYTIHMIDIPDEAAKSVITVRYKSLIPSKVNINIEPISIGYRLAIVNHNNAKESLLAALTVVMMAGSIICILLYPILASLIKVNKQIIYMASALLGVSGYTLTRLWIVYYVLPYSSALYVIEYTSLMLCTAGFVATIAANLDTRFNKFYKVIVSLSFINIIIQTILTFIGVSEYTEMLIVTQAMIVISVLSVVVGFIFTDKKQFPRSRNIVISFIPLMVCFILAIIAHLLAITINDMAFIMVSVIGFIAIQIKISGIEMIHKYRDTINAEMYKKMALNDSLSGCLTRAALNKKKIWLSENLGMHSSIGIISLDLNGLKKVNDTYGHDEGDKLIAEFGKILKRSAQRENLADVYRSGGDEFIVIFLDADESVLDDYVSTLNDKSSRYNAKGDTQPIDFAVGCVLIDGGEGADIDAAIKESDRRMYEHKRKLSRRRRADD